MEVKYLMSGRINGLGLLEIKRKGNYVSLYCPFAHPSVEVNPNSGIEYYSFAKCGHWCPLFKEPVDYGNVVVLSLCKTTLNFFELIDER